MTRAKSAGPPAHWSASAPGSPRPVTTSCAARYWRAARGEALSPLSEALADASLRTPLLSAALLRHAVRGECVPQAHAFLRALSGDGALEPALRELLAVGHHSGGDLARGVLAVGLGRAGATPLDRDDYPLK